jgi:hypothetical protein
MFGMYLWIMMVLGRSAYVRFSSVSAGETKASYFKVFSGTASNKVVQHTNQFNNLHQMPILFFVACLFIQFSNLSDPTFLGLAWAFIGFRVLHSLVHLSYNNVIHRLTLFVISNVILAVMWVRVALSV